LFLRSRIYHWLFVATGQAAWRDSALVDLRSASAIAGARPDIWAIRGEMEMEAALWHDARFSAEQGLLADHLHTHVERLQRLRSSAELVLGEFDRARASCREGAAAFPGHGYFVDCEAEVLGRLSSDPRDVQRLMTLADSISRNPGELSGIVPDRLRLYAVAILARAGLHDSAGQSYDSVMARWHGAVDPVLLLDAVYARQATGDLDSALVMTARAVRLDPGTVASVEQLPWYQELRRHPGFLAAMRGISPREAGAR
jgi:hypothetical protein